VVVAAAAQATVAEAAALWARSRRTWQTHGGGRG
jgi:hypothetical protein